MIAGKCNAITEDLLAVSRLCRKKCIILSYVKNFIEFRYVTVSKRLLQPLGTRGPSSQATASFLDPQTGVVFYTQINKNGVSCWNSFSHPDDYSPETNVLLASDNETMLFPNDLKVDRDSNLWLLTDKLPTHIYRSLNYEEVNYRIFKGAVKELVKGTACEVKEKEPIKVYPTVPETASAGPKIVTETSVSTETSVQQSNSSSVTTDKGQ